MFLFLHLKKLYFPQDDLRSFLLDACVDGVVFDGSDCVGHVKAEVSRCARWVVPQQR